MRKLVFSMLSRAKVFNQNLDVSTHVGSHVFVKSGENVVMTLLDDEKMSDGELLSWYRKRYGGLGLIVRVLSDEGKANEVPQASTEVITASDGATLKEMAVESQEGISGAPEQDTSKVESKVKPSDVDSWSYSQLIAFTKEHNILVKGRAKELYVKAIKSFLKK